MPNLVGIGNSQVPTNGMLGGLAYQDSSVLDQVRSGRKNMIINGDMRICQRFSMNTANNINNATHTYHVDRFKAYESTDGILQGEWENDNYSDAGFQYSVKYTPATADTSLSNNQMAFISQVIEMENMRHLGYGLSYAKTCTLSFYVKSNKIGTYCIALINQNSNNRFFVTEYQINTANTWERKTITIPGDRSGTWNTQGLRIAWTLASSSDRWASTTGVWVGGGTALYGTNNQVNFMDNTSNTFSLTGVQFEIGLNATDFEHCSYGSALLDCYRYYVRLYASTSDFAFGYGYKYTNTAHAISVPLPTRLIQAPSTQISGLRIRGGNTNGVNNAETVTSIDNPTAYSFGNMLFFTANTNVNSAVIGQTVVLTNSVSNSSSYLAFDAEL